MDPVRLNLRPEMFTRHAFRLVEVGSLTAELFRYESGVCAVRLGSDEGELTMLPYQGQQIWAAKVGGRDLTMKSMFPTPRPTQEYLHNYGAFLLHCGATAMGVPRIEDSHPLHGELPNAPYQQAYLEVGDGYLALGGQYQHTVAFTTNYLAEPRVTLHAGSTIFDVQMRITNLMQRPIDYMYLAHINFRPVDDATLVYSALPRAETVRVRTSIPVHITPPEGYVSFIDRLKAAPEVHHMLSPGLPFDPEVVFEIDYLADETGWAHSMQVHPDGQADYAAHRPAELDYAVRWISRTGDQDALGLVLPGTAGVEGYSLESAKGRVRSLPAGESFSCAMRIGTLTAAQANRQAQHITTIKEKASG